ncbi:ABC transporter permease [Lachnoclostridium phytofermentans]|uniref:ABC-2 type transporter n=1 Tax=Lachnoclostridium phytofermentans (strain ATCC 700394 / DSM 18823 / ISDg) TaxID=357809 RepID=A9KNA3_LACP7|nr:ABC transporter permease [Lachnoclostridium phytofermentans]ABX41602.1 ABC-2 type transporter [Lachnoclostridium phytofermentans ISDg]
MFFHQYKYRIKYFLKTPTILFWAFFFPLILGTLFRAAFGDAMLNLGVMDSIPVAVVIEKELPQEHALLSVLPSVTYKDETPMFQVTKTTREEADQMLREGTVNGIIVLSDTVELFVSDSELQTNILKQFLDQYSRMSKAIEDIARNNPQSLPKAISLLQSDAQNIVKVSLNGKNTNGFIQYFYSLIAMACMFGSYLGLSNSMDIQGNQKPVAARRCITPTNKLILILADSSAAVTIHFLELIVVWIYLRLVLGIPIGDQPLFFLLTVFIGSVIGIAYGQFVGSISKGHEALRFSIVTGISLVFSFLSGLMVDTIKHVIEVNVPLLNRINPASLITDAFYSLTVFSDYSRFTSDIVSLIVIAAIFILASFLILRRERYDSI